jgi:hypothetical protein
MISYSTGNTDLFHAQTLATEDANKQLNKKAKISATVIHNSRARTPSWLKKKMIQLGIKEYQKRISPSSLHPLNDPLPII